MSDASQLVKQERRGRTALLTLNRPEALNALDSATLDALREIGSELAGDRELRAVVVTGEGRAFAAGADISEMVSMSSAEAAAFSRRGHQAFAAFEALEVPTIAAVNGFALGGGCELACACDWIYASTKAQFGQPEVGLGIIPGFGGTSRLTRRVGVAWSKEICLTGARLKADEALRIGLVNRVFEPDELLGAALAAAEAIAANGPLAVGIAKRVIQEGQQADLPLANAYEQAAFGMTFGTEDRAEGMQAFLAKREAAFSGK